MVDKTATQKHKNISKNLCAFSEHCTRRRLLKNFPIVWSCIAKYQTIRNFAIADALEAFSSLKSKSLPNEKAPFQSLLPTSTHFAQQYRLSILRNADQTKTTTRQGHVFLAPAWAHIESASGPREQQPMGNYIHLYVQRADGTTTEKAITYWCPLGEDVSFWYGSECWCEAVLGTTPPLNSLSWSLNLVLGVILYVHSEIRSCTSLSKKKRDFTCATPTCFLLYKNIQKLVVKTITCK